MHHIYTYDYICTAHTYLYMHHIYIHMYNSLSLSLYTLYMYYPLKFTVYQSFYLCGLFCGSCPATAVGLQAFLLLAVLWQATAVALPGRFLKKQRSQHGLNPGKLTWNLKITCLKRKIIFQTSIFGFHVNFQGCILCFFCIDLHGAQKLERLFPKDS